MLSSQALFQGRSAERLIGGLGTVATIITGDKLRTAVTDQSFIKNGDPTSVEGVKYDFRMSSRILKGSHTQPIDITSCPNRTGRR
jgi:hypothetical protein